MMPAYVLTLQECLLQLETAYREAEAELPEEIRTEHWIKSKHSPSAWNDVYHAHMGELLVHGNLVNALLALTNVTSARTLLQAVLYELEERPVVNLKLGKMR